MLELKEENDSDSFPSGFKMESIRKEIEKKRTQNILNISPVSRTGQWHIDLFWRQQWRFN